MRHVPTRGPFTSALSRHLSNSFPTQGIETLLSLNNDTILLILSFLHEIFIPNCRALRTAGARVRVRSQEPNRFLRREKTRASCPTWPTGKKYNKNVKKMLNDISIKLHERIFWNEEKMGNDEKKINELFAITPTPQINIPTANELASSIKS